MVYPPEQQGVGAFDDGKIVEQRPIGFPREPGAVKRVGTIFYWAWAEAKQTGYIPPHPHQAFEILTYVLRGEGEHGDSLNNMQRISTGGVQYMQAGSGVYHSETLFEGAEIFQIWFEPDLRETIHHKPTYHQVEHEEFPFQETEGVHVKTVIGEGSPVSLLSTPKMFDIEISAGKTFTYSISEGNALAVVVVRGKGSVQQPTEEYNTSLQYRDFSVITTDEEAQVMFRANEDENFRIVLIEVPEEVDYPLYQK